MNELGFFDKKIEQKLLSIRTADLAKVISVSGSTARLQPLTMRKAVGGVATKQSTITAEVPQNIKAEKKTITYMKSLDKTESLTVLVPASLKAGDIVCVGFCERDISNAKKGVISEATNRHHNVNDGIILCVL